MSRRFLRTIATCAAFALLVLADAPVIAQDAAKPAQEPKPSMDIYGFAMLDIGQNFKTINPNWFDTMRVHEAAVVGRPVRQGRHTFAGVRQTRFGVKTLHADRARRAEDPVRVRVVRHGRGRGPDDVPAAPCLRRARARSAPARRGARSWIPTSSRTRSSTGGRPAWCSSGTCRCAGCRIKGDNEAHAGRSSGRARAATRASTRTVSSCRTSRGASRCRTSRARTRMAGSGATSRSPACSAASTGTTCCDDQFDLSGSATGLGPELSART